MNRIKILRDERFMSQSELGAILGVTSQAIGLYENGKRDIPTEYVIKLANYFNVTVDYLLGNSDFRSTLTIGNKDESSNNMFMVPVYGDIAAGQPNWAVECLEGYLPVDPNLMNIINPEEVFFLKVNGESMNKIIRNGAYALIRKTDFVENGDIAVVLVDGYNATLKKFNKTGNMLVLSPESYLDTFEPLVIDLSTSNPVIIGKYIGKFEINK